jgi:hypothetical protein
MAKKLMMDSIAEEKAEMRSAKPQARKRGGAVHGAKMGGRPDRRARGGAMGSDPVSAAGAVSKPSYQDAGKTDYGSKGEGADKT